MSRPVDDDACAVKVGWGCLVVGILALAAAAVAYGWVRI